MIYNEIPTNTHLTIVLLPVVVVLVISLQPGFPNTLGRLPNDLDRIDNLDHLHAQTGQQRGHGGDDLQYLLLHLVLQQRQILGHEAGKKHIVLRHVFPNRDELMWTCRGLDVIPLTQVTSRGVASKENALHIAFRKSCRIARLSRIRLYHRSISAIGAAGLRYPVT